MYSKLNYNLKLFFWFSSFIIILYSIITLYFSIITYKLRRKPHIKHRGIISILFILFSLLLDEIGIYFNLTSVIFNLKILKTIGLIIESFTITIYELIILLRVELIYFDVKWTSIFFTNWMHHIHPKYGKKKNHYPKI